MNRLQELFAEVGSYLQKLSPRERLLVGLTAGAAVLLLLFFSGLGFVSAVHRHQLAIENKTKALREISQLAGSYAERSRSRQQLEQRLKNKVALFTFIDEVSKKKHIEIGDMQDRGNTVGQDKITESTVELDLTKVTLDRLTAFLKALEHDPRLIRVKKIRVRGRIDDPNSVDASLTISAYSSGST